MGTCRCTGRQDDREDLDDTLRSKEDTRERKEVSIRIQSCGVQDDTEITGKQDHQNIRLPSRKMIKSSEK